MLEETELFYLENPEMLKMLRNVHSITQSLTKQGSSAASANKTSSSTKRTHHIKSLGRELTHELQKRYKLLVSCDLLTILYVRVSTGKHEISAYIDLEQRFRVAEGARAKAKQEELDKAEEAEGIDDKDNEKQDEVDDESDIRDLISKWLDIWPQNDSDLSQYNHTTNIVISNNSKNFSLMIQNNNLIFKAVKTSKLYQLIECPKISVSDDRFKQICLYDFYQTRK